MAKRKARFNSLTTPGKKQDCSNYLVELTFIRQNRGNPMPPEFWKKQKYKFAYKREIQACRKFIKKYGEALVLQAAIRNADIVRWTDFAKVEFILQKHDELKRLRDKPKDTTPVEKESVSVGEDYRDFQVERQKTLFERLEELDG